MRRTARVTLPILVLLGSMGALGAFVLHNRQANSFYSPYAVEPYPAARLARLARAHHARRVVLHTDDGLGITGVVREPPTPAAPWLVAFAGNGSGQVGSALTLFAAVDPDRSFGWAAFPYRGFDSAPGVPSFPRLHADARALVDLLVAEHGAAPARIHIIGFSLGTEVAIQLVTDGHFHEPFASLVLLAPFVAPYCQLAAGRVHRYLPAHDCTDPRSRLARILIRTLIVHGADDAVHPVREAHRAAAGIAHAELVVVPHGAHIDALQAPRATQTVARFLAGAADESGHAASMARPTRF